MSFLTFPLVYTPVSVFYIISIRIFFPRYFLIYNNVSRTRDVHAQVFSLLKKKKIKNVYEYYEVLGRLTFYFSV